MHLHSLVLNFSVPIWNEKLHIILTDVTAYSVISLEPEPEEDRNPFLDHRQVILKISS